MVRPSPSHLTHLSLRDSADPLALPPTSSMLMGRPFVAVQRTLLAGVPPCTLFTLGGLYEKHPLLPPSPLVVLAYSLPPPPALFSTSLDLPRFSLPFSQACASSLSISYRMNILEELDCFPTIESWGTGQP